MTAPSNRLLVVHLNGVPVGRLSEGDDGLLCFSYDGEYRNRLDATPLSHSLPLAAPSHAPVRVAAFFWGLLPDNESTLANLALRAATSASNLIGLLASAGRDTAGALEILAPTVDPHRPSGVEWIDEHELALRVAEVRRSAATGLPTEHDNGRWSLAGAQGKLALRFEDGRWGVPWGAEATTHIIKPAVLGFAGSDITEAVVLSAARSLGLPSARSSVLSLVDGTHALVSARYDRVHHDGGWTRVHQEDLCQALGVPTSQKYQSDGGPSVERVGALLHTLTPSQGPSAEQRFFDALAYSYAIASTDGHAKNYSILMSAGRSVLAPLYDMNSALPYTRPYGRRYASVRKLHAAFRYGRTDALTRIERGDWEAVAESLHLEAGRALARLREILVVTPTAVAKAQERVMSRAGLSNDLALPWKQLLADYQSQLHPSVTQRP